MTLNDLERRNSPNGTVISPNSVAFGADYAKVVEDTQILSAAEMQPKECSFSGMSLMVILHGIASSESIKVRHSPLASENLTITWKRCKIEGQLLLMTNGKLYMGFRLVPKLVTLNDLERCNGHYFALFRGIL